MGKDKTLQHFGILGMHWGVRRGDNASGGTTGRKTNWNITKNVDGRKSNKIFGKRNRTAAKKAIRNFFLGDPDKFLRDMPILNKKYKKASKEDKAIIRSRTSKALAAVSVIGIASALATMYSYSKYLD